MKKNTFAFETKHPTTREVFPQGLYLSNEAGVTQAVEEFQKPWQVRLLNLQDLQNLAKEGDAHLEKFQVPKRHAVGTVIYLSPPALPKAHSAAAAGTSVSLELSSKGWKVRRLARQNRWAESYGSARTIHVRLSSAAQRWIVTRYCPDLVCGPKEPCATFSPLTLVPDANPQAVVPQLA